MLSRTAKQLVRIQLREYNRCNKQSASPQLFAELICEYLNVFTGFSAVADEVFQQTLYSQARQRFGVWAIAPSEKLLLQRVTNVIRIVIVNHSNI